MHIKCTSIEKSFNGERIVTFDALEIASGECLGILGNNGSGKSTFLKMLAGWETEYSGQILFDGKPRDASIDRQMTFVPQKPFMLKRSVEKNLAYPLLVRKENPDTVHKAVEDMASRLGLTPLLHKRADRLSGGEMQKVQLGRALIFRPKLLLLDEPTASIDSQFFQSIAALLKEYLEETHTTMVLVTHQPQLTTQLCQRTLQFKRGQQYEILSND